MNVPPKKAKLKHVQYAWKWFTLRRLAPQDARRVREVVVTHGMFLESALIKVLKRRVFLSLLVPGADTMRITGVKW